ncbi:hypothetical protein ABHI18_009811 [Aspergillus niger]
MSSTKGISLRPLTFETAFIVTIAVGVQDRPAAAPKPGAWQSDYKLFNRPSFAEAQKAISTIIFAYAGTPAFFPIVSEMRDPRQYTKALVPCQTLVSVTYITIGVVIYYYCGTYVVSPALGSAGPTIKKVSYGVALPGLFVTTILWTHLPAKYVFVRILQGSPHLTANTLNHWITWIGSTFTITITMGIMWLYDNWSSSKRDHNRRWLISLIWSVFTILVGTYLMIGGTYSCILTIFKSYRESGGTSAWSCADNSSS